jgi:uncharacterized protein (DUF2141 family)
MAADLTINLKGFKDASGGAIVWLWKNADGFPTKMEKATLKQSAEIKDKSATVVFKGLEPGVYAINIAHDENGNGKLDTGFMGRPKEGWGASNNPHNRMSPPSFEQAKFTVGKDDMTLEIQVQY